jgi:photosystem II stability/assembly factor-like uncharacterized protein
MITLAAIAVASALWQPLGPEGTPGITAIAVHPRQRRLIYIAAGYPGFTSGSAVYRSDDGGLTWTERDRGLPRVRNIGDIRSLAVDPSGGVYAAIGGDGVYRSTNGGESWNRSLTTPGAWAVAADAVSGRVYASSIADVYRFEGGAWTRMGAAGDDILALATDPIDGHTVYAISGSNIVNYNSPFELDRSSDGGATWTKVYSKRSVVSIAIDANGAVLIGAADAHDSTVPMLARSADRGASWSDVGPALRAMIVPWNVIISVAFDGTTIYAASSDSQMFRSTDGGVTWSKVIDYRAQAQIGPLAVGESGVVLAGASSLEQPGGIARRSSGDAWPLSNAGIHSVQVGSIVAKPPYLFAAVMGPPQDLGLQRFDGVLWRSVRQAYDINLLRASGSRLFAATGSGLQVSSDNGDHWGAAGSGIDCQTIDALLVDAAHPQTLYARATTYVQARTRCVGAFRSTDGAATWSHADAGLPLTITNPFAHPLGPMTVSRGGTLLLALNADDRSFAGLRRSSDGGVNWTTVAVPAAAHAYDLAADGADDKLLYLLTDSGVFSSSNGGDSWQLSLPLTATGGQLLAAPARGHVFVTDGQSIYETSDAGALWTRISDTLPGAPLLTLALDGNGRLVAGTDGSGLFVAAPAPRRRAARR